MKTEIKRVFLIVLDSFGAGELPDAEAYGDVGSSTLRAVSASSKLRIPNLTRLGLYSIPQIDCEVHPDQPPEAVYGKMAEASAGKDTTTGHWELAGLISPQAMPVFPNGFPEEVLRPFEEATGRGVLCNRPYSGTQVIREYGEEHLQSGKWIVYTSADSVFQLAAHESIIPVEELYEACRTARGILSGPYAVGRVIARPFAGEAPDFYRTQRRHDFSLKPPAEVLPQALQRYGLDTIAVGKIYDIFAGAGFDAPHYTRDNREGMRLTKQYAGQDFHGLCFTNLVDFDMLYGHRNDIDGYAAALTEFDQWLGEFLPLLKEGDRLVITADHGCDPSTPSTDHSREYVPLLIWGKGLKPHNLGTRRSYADLGKTIADWFAIPNRLDGTSFAEEVQ